jgi:hypothetical protein
MARGAALPLPVFLLRNAFFIFFSLVTTLIG